MDGVGEVDLLFLDDFGQFDDVFSVKWGSESIELVLSIEHPVEADTEGVDIGLVGVILVLEDFRGHVEGRAEHGFGPAFFVEDFGESEIGNFDNTVVSENIGEFQVSVDDFVFVKMVEAMNQFAHDTDSLILYEIFFLFQIRVKVPIITILQDQVVIVVGFLHIIELDNVGALTAFEDLDFALKQLLELA